MKDLACSHEISKNTAKKVHCACLIPAADYLKAKFPVGGPTHRQDHPEHKQIVAEAKARTYGCVGYPLYPAIPVILVVYGGYHNAMCQNISKCTPFVNYLASPYQLINAVVAFIYPLHDWLLSACFEIFKVFLIEIIKVQHEVLRIYSDTISTTQKDFLKTFHCNEGVIFVM